MAIQNQLRSKVSFQKLSGEERIIAGCDVAYDKRSDRVFAAVVVIDNKDLKEVTRSTAIRQSEFPYIPGLLSFREAPAILDALKKLDVKPDLLLVDGQGYAHQRRFGVASHLGLLLDIPAVGCAKSVLIGAYEDPTLGAGNWSFLIDNNEIVGAALRTKQKVNPVFVSVGHLITLEEAITVVMKCCAGYRIPEPIRRAHQIASLLLRRGEE